MTDWLTPYLNSDDPEIRETAEKARKILNEQDIRHREIEMQQQEELQALAQRMDERDRPSGDDLDEGPRWYRYYK